VKKITTILLLVIYALSAVGISLNFHYCHEQLAKVSFQNFGGQKGCACNPKDIPKDCCKDELTYQKSDNHRSVQPAQTFELISFVFNPLSSADYSAISLNKGKLNFVLNNQRRSCPEPIYLLNRVFRI
jgi:hypothetical protein